MNSTSPTSVKARIQRTKREIVLASALTVAALVAVFAAVSGGETQTAVTANEPSQMSSPQ